jgi:hypothetical protein
MKKKEKGNKMIISLLEVMKIRQSKNDLLEIIRQLFFLANSGKTKLKYLYEDSKKVKKDIELFKCLSMSKEDCREVDREYEKLLKKLSLANGGKRC